MPSPAICRLDASGNALELRLVGNSRAGTEQFFGV